jgi:hypothetical protein
MSVASAVPLQSMSDEVIDYLDRQKIEHSGYLCDLSQGNTISAVLPRDSNPWALIKTDYRIVFHFDGRDRLTKSEIYETYTGP